MKKAERKEQLLRTAYELFLSRGYDAVSVDEIIARAGIAKGTYYYYFSSKEQTLEEVIDMMIAGEAAKAQAIAEMPLPAPQKIAAILSAFRPDGTEQGIVNALNQKDNLLMHERVNAKIIEAAVPLLSRAAEEGIAQGLFECDYIEERVRILMILSNFLFDEGITQESTLLVYIDTVEKMLGVKKGTMDFIKDLVINNKGE